MTPPKPIRVGLAPSLAPFGHEVKYVFRTLLHIAGLPCEFHWHRELGGMRPDIYYGPHWASVEAPVSIASNGIEFTAADRLEPQSFRELEGLAFLEFGPEAAAPFERSKNLRFANDIIFASYWLLTGAHEPRYARDRWDNLDLGGSFFFRHQLTSKPVVSQYGAFLRAHFAGLGVRPVELPWGPVFAFSHDVDYPQMIKWIECLRLAASRGWKSLPSIAGVLVGRNHFWKFGEWVEFEKSLGARPAFYFMARQGSLRQYALGTPDAFYDIRQPEFKRLFRSLNDEGCEIGLHASYNAWRDPDQIGREKRLLEDVACVQVEGNRHHFWHLNPVAPNDTLALHERAGLRYDSSLGLEFYPGFRRGICHPFRVFHPGERRELSILQLPPAWMDDHFDRRLTKNGISEPVVHARSLVRSAVETGAPVIVDYHARGMNGDFYPRYGPWLMDFVQKHLDSSFSYTTPQDLARRYLNYEDLLTANSRDLTAPDTVVAVEGSR